MIELLCDIQRVIHARRVKRMMIKFLKENYGYEVEKADNIFEYARLTNETQRKIVHEEEMYNKIKSEAVEKWKSKLRKKH